jgi:soluble lytic murein transglycosylase-like protein
LALRPTVLGLAVVVAVLLSDTVLVIALGARNSWSRREQSRTLARLDSLANVRETLARTCQVRDILLEVTRSGISSREATLLAREIDRNARLYDFDPLLILAVVLTESGAEFDAVGHGASGTASGALGVMQVQPATARTMAFALGKLPPTRSDLLDPSYNLSVGVAFLLQMIHRYGDLRLGIMAYNVGPGGLESGLRGESALPEGYYRKVLGNYRRLRKNSSRVTLRG